ncbi:hypothetical protein BGZ51_006730 [Haplosporangium sp. Z 767]|nr:hypothetical protein BGZ51_006730 [Haplosporangium sp. Z 767]KAF9182610.1 hypothetical protein BGZ50_004802 [Haplosporangium sp. Z 11]
MLPSFPLHHCWRATDSYSKASCQRPTTLAGCQHPESQEAQDRPTDSAIIYYPSRLKCLGSPSEVGSCISGYIFQNPSVDEPVRLHLRELDSVSTRNSFRSTPMSKD